MFVHEKDGKMEGFTDHTEYFLHTEWWRNISVFSVDKELATKKFNQQKTLQKILVLNLLLIPVAVGAFTGFNYGSWIGGIFAGIGTAFAILVGLLTTGAGEGIEDLNDPNSFYKKYTIRKGNNKNVDLIYPLGIQVSSELFADGNSDFWKKFLSLSTDDHEMLAEATNIMIMENRLNDSLNEIELYLSQTRNSILEKDAKQKRQEIYEIQSQLQKRFDNFVHQVMSAPNNELDKKVIKAMSAVDQIAA